MTWSAGTRLRGCNVSGEQAQLVLKSSNLQLSTAHLFAQCRYLVQLTKISRQQLHQSDTHTHTHTCCKLQSVPNAACNAAGKLEMQYCAVYWHRPSRPLSIAEQALCICRGVRPSVRPSVSPIRRRCCGFVAEGPADGRCGSTVARAACGG